MTHYDVIEIRDDIIAFTSQTNVKRQLNDSYFYVHQLLNEHLIYTSITLNFKSYIYKIKNERHHDFIIQTLQRVKTSNLKIK